MTNESTNNNENGNVKRWHAHKIVGSFLSLMGFFWLSHKLGWMPAHGCSSIFWPIAVIAFGLLLFFGAVGTCKKHSA